MSIFILLYTNLLPIMGEYEKRDNYDDIDSVYKTFFIKNFIENNGITLGGGNYSDKFINATNFCNSIINSEKIEYCESLWEVFEINGIVITNYDLSLSDVAINNRYNDYLSYLPKITNSSFNKRIIVEYKIEVDEEHRVDREERDIYRYSTIGVNIYG